MPQMLIANRLGDGLVVFRAPDGSWVESIEDGALVEDAAADDLLAAGRIDEQHNLIIDPNLIAVGMHAGRRRPEQIREAIRAAGPTIEVET